MHDVDVKHYAALGGDVWRAGCFRIFMGMAGVETKLDTRSQHLLVETEDPTSCIRCIAATSR